MTRQGEDSGSRMLTPIGDELQRRAKPLEVGEPSAWDTARRLTRRPTNTVGSVAYGASIFALVVGAVAAPSYGVGLLLERHSNLGRGLALLVVFLLVGVVACLIGVGSDHVLFGLAVGASLLHSGVGMWGRGHGRGDSYRPSGLPAEPSRLAADPYLVQLASRHGRA